MSDLSTEQLNEILHQFRLKKRTLRHMANHDNMEELGVTLVAQITADMLRAKDPVVEANREELKRRSDVGLAKYGVPLGNGEKTLPEEALMQHALEEALDLANYIQTWFVKRTQNVALSIMLAEYMKRNEGNMEGHNLILFEKIHAALRGGQ